MIFQLVTRRDFTRFWPWGSAVALEIWLPCGLVGHTMTPPVLPQVDSVYEALGHE